MGGQPEPAPGIFRVFLGEGEASEFDGGGFALPLGIQIERQPGWLVC